MVAHACNPGTWEAETGGLQVQDQSQQLCKTLFQNKNKKKLGMVAHAFDPSTWEAEIGGSQVQSQPQQLSEAISNLERPCFKIKRTGSVARR